MRSSLWSSFNSFTNFRLKSYRSKDQFFYEKCLRKFVEEKLKLPIASNLLFYLSSLMSPKDTEKSALLEGSCMFESNEDTKAAKLKEIQEIHDVLYKFSHSKFERFLKNKEVSKLVFYYFKFVKEIQLSKDEQICAKIILNNCQKFNES
jgi:hypothetical protein